MGQNNAHPDGDVSQGGDQSEEQDQVAVQKDEGALDATHLFLACGAEALHILHAPEMRHGAGGSSVPPQQLDRLTALVTKISAYRAQSLEELHLKTQVLSTLVDAGLHDLHPPLAKSVFDDAGALCAQERAPEKGPPRSGRD